MNIHLRMNNSNCVDMLKIRRIVRSRAYICDAVPPSHPHTTHKHMQHQRRTTHRIANENLAATITCVRACVCEDFVRNKCINLDQSPAFGNYLSRTQYIPGAGSANAHFDILRID